MEQGGLIGTVTVAPSLSGYTFIPTSRQVSGPAGDVSFSAAQATYSVMGKVTGPEGAGLSGCYQLWCGTNQYDDAGVLESERLQGLSHHSSLSGYTFTPAVNRCQKLLGDFSATYSISGDVVD